MTVDYHGDSDESYSKMQFISWYRYSHSESYTSTSCGLKKALFHVSSRRTTLNPAVGRAEDSDRGIEDLIMNLIIRPGVMTGEHGSSGSFGLSSSPDPYPIARGIYVQSSKTASAAEPSHNSAVFPIHVLPATGDGGIALPDQAIARHSMSYMLVESPRA